jgi:parallel beta-helix repeat protein
MNRIFASGVMLAAFAFGLAAPRIGHAAESYDNCTGFITSVPASISTPGTWCMKTDLTASNLSTAIFIAANNVTIDCNGFKMVAGTGSASATGILSWSHVNVAVRHCDIRGFQFGVSLTDTGTGSSGHTIEDNRFDSNTGVGISVEGDGSVVRRNWVFNTGYSSYPPTAISTKGTVDILDNTVSIVAVGNSSSPAVGIFSNATTGGSVSGNRVRGLIGGGILPVTYGIMVDGQASLRNNVVTGDGSGNGEGIGCADSKGRAKDNLINGYGAGIMVCSNDGGNVIAP